MARKTIHYTTGTRALCNIFINSPALTTIKDDVTCSRCRNGLGRIPLCRCKMPTPRRGTYYTSCTTCGGEVKP